MITVKQMLKENAGCVWTIAPHDLKSVIIAKIISCQGLKDSDLALKVMEEVNPVRFDGKWFRDGLRDLVESGNIIKIEYTPPYQTRFGPKSFYLLAGTNVRIVNTDQEVTNGNVQTT